MLCCRPRTAFVLLGSSAHTPTLFLKMWPTLTFLQCPPGAVRPSRSDWLLVVASTVQGFVACV